jgi:hypothetical protein
MRLPQNCRSGLHFPFVSPDTSHSLQYPNHQGITWSSYDVSCLGLCTKLTWSPWSLSSELFYLRCQEILESEFICRSGKLSPSAEPQGCCNQAADASPRGRSGDPSSQTECKIPDQAPKLLELKTLWCQKQTHKRQKILTGQFLLTKRVQACAHSS